MLGEKRQFRRLDRGYQNGAVQVLVAPLARGLGQEEAGVAGCPVESQPVLERVVFGTQWVGSTQTHGFEGLIQVPPQRHRLAPSDQPPKGALAIWGGGVEQDAGHRLLVTARRMRIDPLPDARRRVRSCSKITFPINCTVPGAVLSRSSNRHGTCLS